MAVRDWLSVYPTPSAPAAHGGVVPLGEVQGPSRQLAFVDASSLATFPVASMVITVVSQLIESFVPDAAWARGSIPELIVAFAIGALLLFMDLTDPTRPADQNTTRGKISKAAIALVNTCILAASAIGINDTLDRGNGDDGADTVARAIMHIQELAGRVA